MANDGWGGESKFDFISKKTEDAVTAFIKDKNLAEVLFENEYSFFDSIRKMVRHSIIDELFSYGIEMVEYNKILAKTKSNIVLYNNTAGTFLEFGFKGVKSLSELVSKYKNGLQLLQGCYGGRGQS